MIMHSQCKEYNNDYKQIPLNCPVKDQNEEI